MKELFLTCTGKALVPANEEGEEALGSYPKGAILRVRITQPRSNPHNNFFFAFLREAFEAWPSTHRFQPRDYQDHLRAWLLVRAGFSEQVEVDWPENAWQSVQAANMLKAVVAKFSGGRPFWVKTIGLKVVAAWPVSIAFENMDEEYFRRVTTIIFSVIYAETGLDVDEYYSRWQEKNSELSIRPTRHTEEPH